MDLDGIFGFVKNVEERLNPDYTVKNLSKNFAKQLVSLSIKKNNIFGIECKNKMYLGVLRNLYDSPTLQKK